MKVQTRAVLALAIASSASAFAPTSPMLSDNPATSSVALEMAAQQDGKMSVVENLGKGAMSIMAASALSFSASTMILPIEPALAAAKSAPAPVVVDKKATKKANEAKAKADAEKAKIAKMGKEEKEVYLTKKNLALSESSLKEYQKFLSEAKDTETKATKNLKSQKKVAENAKKDFVAASKKLQSAKKQKMPESANKELAAIEAKKKTTLSTEDSKLKQAVSAKSNAEKQVKDGNNSVKKSKESIKKEQKKLKKAEKSYKKFLKNEKKAKAKAAKALTAEKKKFQKLEEEAKKLKSKESATEKELKAKAKALEAEKSQIQKMESQQKQ